MLDRTERQRIFESIIADLNQPRHSGYLSQPVEPIEEWMDGSPLMRVTFPEA